ncbi:MAG: cell division protein FtsZ [Solirubrobacterales bacterium]|nr:cell division protein FtsZ [Solirubrobacterales bacterium]
MSSNKKRASMREGPLAALFRKTDEAEGTPQAEDERVSETRAAQPSAAEPAQERLAESFTSERQAERRPLQSNPSEPTSSEQNNGEPLILVVGVGGAGVNAINRMVEAGVGGVEFIAVNTDVQSLQQSAADHTLHIGEEVTRGLGSGSDPEIGRRAAMDDHDEIKAALRGADMVFVAVGAGGGTGTGAAPVVARIARDAGALVVGIVTRPFNFEGTRRGKAADAGIESLGNEVDTLITVPNNKLLDVLEHGTSMVEAFRVADDVLRQGVQGISDLVTLPGLINLDFADVRTIMTDAGTALLGIGMGTGERRALDAAEGAISSPLLETSVEGARSILLSVTGGPDIALWEVNEAAKAVSDVAHPDANIIFGAMVDDTLGDQVWVTVVATGYANERAARKARRDVAAALGEPSGEPRVERRRSSSRSGGDDIEVPEFLSGR